MPKEYTYEYHAVGDKMEGANVPFDYVFGFAYNKILYTGQTKFQKIELFDTPLFGKMLKLDGQFQTSEKDEFFYHEMQVHVPMCSHPKPEKVLIIGAGDGGILKNVLMHKTVKKAVMVEIDAGVVEFSMKYLTAVCGNAFKDKRAQVIIGDGKKFVEETKDKFDVIILDLTDPIGPSKALYTREFYQKLSGLLNKNGLLQLHDELVITRPKISKQVYDSLASVFKHVKPSTNYVPLYGTLMAFCTCSQDVDASKIKASEAEKRLRARGVNNLKMYNGEWHEAVFKLPNYLKKLYGQG